MCCFSALQYFFYSSLLSAMATSVVLEKVDYMYPGFNEGTSILPANNDDSGSDEDPEIEIVVGEPSFLRGQTRMTMQHSPVNIVKV